MFGVFKAASACVWVSGRAQWTCSNILPHVRVSDSESENWSCGAGDETSAPGYSSVLVVTPELFFINSTVSNYFCKYTIFPNLFSTCSDLALWLISRVFVLQECFLLKITVLCKNIHLIQKSHTKGEQK